jgi:hypothetical protein
MPAQQMHKYVLGWVGLFIAFAVTFTIAIARVSQTKKFAGQAVKSLDCSGKSLKTRNVVSWKDTCSQMQVGSLEKP